MAMNNAISEAYLNDTIKIFRSEQSSVSNKQDFNMSDGDKDNDNKYIKLLCSVVESLLKIKAYKEPKPEKEPKDKKKPQPTTMAPNPNNLKISFSH